jgi:hypothetical protein
VSPAAGKTFTAEVPAGSERACDTPTARFGGVPPLKVRCESTRISAHPYQGMKAR